MNVALYSGFKDELTKISSAWHNPAEIAGLGVLAVPGIKTLRDPNASAKEKSHAKWETAGLGALAIPAAHNMYTAAKGVGKTLAKHASDLWNPSTGAVSGASGGTRAMNMGTHVGAAKAAPKPQFTMAHLQAAKAKLKPALGSAVRSVASHLR